MAKGQSTFRQLGKIDGRKYYQVKGVDGIVSQSINQGMSNRVKNDAAYANTRLNNAEFGGAGSTAGAITRALSQKWRYLLVPFATGKIAKDVRAIMMQDESGAWGQRGLTGTNWQAALAEKISAYSKNSIRLLDDFQLNVNFNSSTGMNAEVTFNDSFKSDYLKALGCAGAHIVVLAGDVEASYFDSTTGRYVPASASLQIVGEEDVIFGDEGGVGGPVSSIKVTSQASDSLFCGIAVVLPYKEVNGEKYIMQEHCMFQMAAAKANA